ncbi:MAG: cupin domain-containing protein [Polynucleobacter sp.]|jgi:quercetin dioxygenase-like cupin family protein|nr:cupin domain-containing protein [Polynucleobacter sp.]
MKKEIFTKAVLDKGYTEPELVVQQPNGYLDFHSHQYESAIMVIEGQVNITAMGQKSTYLSGDVFHLQANQPHCESYGSKGVKYLQATKDRVEDIS